MAVHLYVKIKHVIQVVFVMDGVIQLSIKNAQLHVGTD
jgi:hypothetical protein